MGTEGSNRLTTFYQNDSFPRLLQHADSLPVLSRIIAAPAVCSAALVVLRTPRESPQVRFRRKMPSC
jgi:hypothetical protein